MTRIIARRAGDLLVMNCRLAGPRRARLLLRELRMSERYVEPFPRTSRVGQRPGRSGDR